MLTIDRRFYAPKDPYTDCPQVIKDGINLSAPHMHAHALELLKDHLKEGNKGN
jgi:protein-L-isoaspartate(D-aspartate) O-methyltransferase